MSNGPSAREEQRLRRQVLKDDQKAATTMHALAQLGDTSLSGRFAADGMVSGTAPTTDYPRLPSSSPWSGPQPGPEPPLGFAIDAQEPVGEAHEVAASLAEARAPTVVGLPHNDVVERAARGGVGSVLADTSPPHPDQRRKSE